MWRKLIGGLAIAVLVTIGLAPAVSAGKKAQPEQSGIVSRIPAIGGHVVGPVLVNVDGAAVPMVLAVGWDSVLGLCSGPNAQVVNGVLQALETPSGNGHVVVHNEDVPALLFDVSGFSTEEEFIAACFEGQVQAFATGTLKQRPILVGNPSGFSIKVASKGTLSGPSGDWDVKAFLKVVFGDGPEPVSLKEWITVKAA